MVYGHEWCFESSQNCTSRRRVQFENFQNITSDHKSRNARAGSYDFYLLYSQQNYSNALLCSCSHSSSFGFSFLSVAHVCQTFNQVCVAFNVFLFFAFSLSCSTMFWFDKANRLSTIFFHFGVQIWRFPGVSIATSVLHSITYLCIRHWPIRNKIFCWVYIILYYIILYYIILGYSCVCLTVTKYRERKKWSSLLSSLRIRLRSQAIIYLDNCLSKTPSMGFEPMDSKKSQRSWARIPLKQGNWSIRKLKYQELVLIQSKMLSNLTLSKVTSPLSPLNKNCIV